MTPTASSPTRRRGVAAAACAVVVLLAAGAVIERSDSRDRTAETRALVARAAAALDRGDAARAARLLDGARAEQAVVPEYGTVRARADAMAARQRERALRRRALAAFAAGHYSEAVVIVEGLSDRAGHDLAERLERDGAQRLRIQARGALEARAYERAIALAEEAEALRVTGPGTAILREARAAQRTRT